MSTNKKLVVGALVALGLMVPVISVQAGLFDWLFGKKHKHAAKETTGALSIAKLDSSSKWVCHVKGACAKEGICCASGLKSHLAGVKNVEAVEVDRETGLVTLTIKEGKRVKTSALQKAGGWHWRIKDMKREEAI